MSRLDYDIPGIMRKEFGLETLCCDPMQRNSSVYDVQTNDGRFVVKVAQSERNKSGIRNEIAINLLIKNKVRVPTLILAGFEQGFMITEYSGPGNFYDYAKFTPHTDELFVEMGQILQTIHSYKFNRMGKFTDGYIEDLSTPFTTAAVNNGFSALKKVGDHLGLRVRRAVEALLADPFPDLEEEWSLLHFDYHPGQLIIGGYPWSITGVVDFEIAHVGPPVIDLVRVERFMMGQGPDKRELFFKGYEKPAGYESRKLLYLVVELLVFAMINQQAKKMHAMHSYLKWLPKLLLEF